MLHAMALLFGLCLILSPAASSAVHVSSRAAQGLGRGGGGGEGRSGGGGKA